MYIVREAKRGSARRAGPFRSGTAGIRHHGSVNGIPLLTSLASATSSRRIWEVLGVHESDPAAADLGMAMGGLTTLNFATNLPLAEHPAPSTRRWVFMVDDAAAFSAGVRRLDEAIDDLTNPLLVSRIADLLWTESPPVARSFERHAQRALDAYGSAAR